MPSIPSSPQPANLADPAAQTAPARDRMTKSELRASLSLASIFALRMLGLFLILPVFAEYARGLPDGQDAQRIGLAMGIYGLMQAFLHIPLGWLSDRIGRKPVMVAGLLLFVAGALVAAFSDTLAGITIGRAMQGMGAISAAITACIADLTRERHRTKAMAMVGGSIGLTFALSLVIASPLLKSIGMSGIFGLMAVLGVLAIGVTLFLVPAPPPPHPVRMPFRQVLLNADLIRMNVGVLALHASQVAMFMVVPAMLADAGMPLDQHWKVYLPVVLVSFVLMLGPMMAAERYGRVRPVLLASVALMTVVQLLFAAVQGLWPIVGVLLLFFVAFNVLEAMQPSLVSRYAAAGRGAALGVYNTTQALGLFLGGVVGGWLLKHEGRSAVFLGCAAVLVLWLIIAWSMKAPPARGQEGASAVAG
ncbi:Predicted arabinose efflux permease, MFS family [Cupriavidus sp. OV038]|jgi:MFS family permease|uniref:MFS transporter n=1 Tax=unclassified Cupriavidus TaxID=2640874 RepID=UPI0008E7CC6C|nr:MULTISPECIES: MFS transporter [unclassified Cupriavidus]SFC81448.1 Predicted arabinose efflux permease, MFS family [Cupriavidus sp. OV038]SFO78433.1 Predicted arabinose efflux permease, MFS family [Cupriavidus sp. OV096]